MTAKQRLIVIGNGMAGARLVEEVVARGGADQYDILVFGEEPSGNYNRILLSGVLAGSHDASDIFLNTASWYEANGVKLHAGVRAGWIDRLSKAVYAPGGVAEPYDKLVIATGSAPFLPPVSGLTDEEGNTKPGIFSFRNLGDCQDILEYASNVRRVAVIGGGLLGLEAARGLLNRGLEVHIAHLQTHLMEAQLEQAAGAILKRIMETLGVKVHLDKLTTAIIGEDRVTGLVFKDGSALDCEMVVVAAGIRPNVELAKNAGIQVQRGIIVRDDLSCRNDPDVYAIGECAQHRGQVYGLVGPAWEQARVLADRLTGANPDAAYSGSRVSTRLKVMGVDLAVMGDKEPQSDTDEVVCYSEPRRGVYKKLVVRDGQLAGAIILGDGLAIPAVIQAFDQGLLLPENRAELLFPTFGDSNPSKVADLPDNARICNCNCVTKGRIAAAVREGFCTVAAIEQATRAGAGCGACKPQVSEVLQLTLDKQTRIKADETSAAALLTV